MFLLLINSVNAKTILPDNFSNTTLDKVVKKALPGPYVFTEEEQLDIEYQTKKSYNVTFGLDKSISINTNLDFTDSDGDGIDDENDLDSDNDGILDSIEGKCDSILIPGDNAHEITDENNVEDEDYAINGNENNHALFNNSNDYLIVELRENSAIVEAGTIINILARITNTSSIMYVSESLDGTNFTNQIEFTPENTSDYEDYEYTLLTNATHIKVGFNKSGSSSLRVANISYPDFYSSDCSIRDTDNDGVPDYLDLDSDNDGIYDIVEAGGSDTDKDGLVDDSADLDGDGLADIYDDSCTNTVSIGYATSVSETSINFSNTTNALGEPGTTYAQSISGNGKLYLGFSETIPANTTLKIYMGLTTSYNNYNRNVGIRQSDSNGTSLSNYTNIFVSGTGPTAYSYTTDSSTNNYILIDDFSNSGVLVYGISYDTSSSGGSSTSDCSGTLLTPRETTSGIPDYINRDSDGDGCFDVAEAGFTDANADGEIDGTGYDSYGVVQVSNSGDGYSGTTPAVIDSTDNSACYEFIDSDNDGVEDAIDLDDDNDGIYDTEEGYCNTTTAASTGWNSSDTYGFNFTETNLSGTSVDLTFNATYNGGSVNTTGGQDSGVYDDGDGLLYRIGWEDFYDDDPTENAKFKFSFSEEVILTQFIVKDVDRDPTYFDPIKFSAKDINGNDVDLTINTGSSIKISSDGNGVYYSEEDENNEDNDEDFWITISSTVPIIEFTVIALPIEEASLTPDGEVPPSTSRIIFSDVVVALCESLDTDEDGVPDYLDLDADDDGCNDVLEAGFTDTDGDGQIDGNDTVDEDGVVQESDGYTGTNSSVTDSSVKSCSETIDTDNDGIPDSTDLDDDNDGILDTDEMQNCEINSFATTVDAFWSLDNNTNDISGNGKNAQGGNAPSFSTDAVQGTHSASFDGSSNQIIYSQGNGFMELDYLAISFSAWIKPDNLNGNRIIYEEGGGTNGSALWLNNNILTYSTRNGTIQKNVAHPTAVVSDTWQHVAVTFNAGILTVYLNGVPESIDYSSEYESIGNHSNDGGLGGPLGGATAADVTGFYSGLMDAARYALAVWSAEDIATEAIRCDFDGDGVPNHLDLDSDNDGIYDIVEAGGLDDDNDGKADDYVDTNNDGVSDNLCSGGVINAVNSTVTQGSFTNPSNATGATGLSDTQAAVSTRDSSGDPDDHLLFDLGQVIPVGTNITIYAGRISGGDQTVNIIESDVNGNWQGGSGHLYSFTVNSSTPISGYSTTTEYDTQYIRLDIYWDDVQIFGIEVDTGEGSSCTGVGLTPTETTSGTPDFLNTNSDGDACFDVIEAGFTDADGDGQIDGNGTVDTNGVVQNSDGYTGTTDEVTNSAIAYCDDTDTDKDGIIDSIDIDDDNDGILDVDETYEDFDGDGIPNHLDLDSDNDGIYDLLEAGGLDEDNNGIVDDLTDLDNDGLADIYDASCSDSSTGTIINATSVTSASTFTNPSNAVGDPGTSYALSGSGTSNLVLNLGQVIAENSTITIYASNTNGGSSNIDTYHSNANGTNGLAIATVSVSGSTKTAYTITTQNETQYLRIAHYNGNILRIYGIEVDTSTNNCSGIGLTPIETTIGVPNYLNLDSDGDDCNDVIEARFTDSNGDGKKDGTVDEHGVVQGVDGYTGTLSAVTSSYYSEACNTTDTDNDGVIDTFDLDDDNDGILDVAENGNCNIEDKIEFIELLSEDFGTGTARGSNPYIVNHKYDSQGDIPDGYYAVVSSLSDGLAIWNRTETNDDLDANIDQDSGPDGGSNTGRYLSINLGNDADNVAFYRRTLNDLTVGADYRFRVDVAGLCTGDNCSDVPEFRLEIQDSTTGDVIEVIESSDLEGDNAVANDDIWRRIVLNFTADRSTIDVVIINDQPNGISGNDFGVDNIVFGVLQCTSESIDNDNDGIINSLDLDSDNDGIPDVIEAGGVDADNDGKADGDVGTTITTEGVPSSAGTDGLGVIAPIDSDNDGISNYLDLDADNDGIPDIVEAGGVDTDGNGLVDDIDGDNYGILENDTDEDGLDDLYDANNGGNNITNPDTDGDGIPDYIDLDSDNDGIPDVVEAGGTDTNGDGRVDSYFGDDGDGFNDIDGDGFIDVVDGDVGNDGDSENIDNALLVTGNDDNDDGIPDSYPNGDFDGDGILNQLDLDSDNDGILDAIEAGGTDEDRDGEADDFVDDDNDGFNDNVDGDPTNSLPAGDDTAGDNTANALIVTGADSDFNGEPNSYPNGDFDNDGNLNFLDIDADDDGIPDNIEGQPTIGYIPPSGVIITDENNNGVDDNYENGTTLGLDVVDTDSDGTPDYLDADSDNDGILDIEENGDTENTASGDDSDGDGLDDAFDDNDDLETQGFTVNDGLSPNNTVSDIDSLINSFGDEDNDATTIGDLDYRDALDTDQDGIPDNIDIDDDNDGILDTEEGCGELIVNGSFELQDFSDETEFPGGFTDASGTFIGTNYNTNTLTGWTYTQNLDGWIGDQSPSWSNEVTYASAYHGNQYIDVIGNNDQTGGVSNVLSQTINTIPGNSYTISFYWGEDVGHEVGQDVTLDINVLDSSDTAILNETLTGIAEGNINGVVGPKKWYYFSDTFVATTTESTVQFIGTPPSTGSLGAGVDLDYVSVTSTTCRDTDEDGIPDSLDLDSDNDGIPDNIEAQSTVGYIAPTGIDTDNDGLDDAYDTTPDGDEFGTGSLGLSPVNTDETATEGSDTVPDYLDTDSDGDGLYDIEESGENLDSDSNGMVTGNVGVNGLVDEIETNNIDQGYTDVNGGYDDTQIDNFDDEDEDVLTFGDVDYRDTTLDGVPMITQVYQYGSERWIEVTNISEDYSIPGNLINILLYNSKTEDQTDVKPDVSYTIAEELEVGQSVIIGRGDNEITNYNENAVFVENDDLTNIEGADDIIILSRTIDSTSYANRYDIVESFSNNSSYVRIDETLLPNKDYDPDEWVVFIDDLIQTYSIIGDEEDSSSEKRHPEAPLISEIQSSENEANTLLGLHRIDITRRTGTSWSNGYPDRSRFVVIEEDFNGDLRFSARKLTVNAGSKLGVSDNLLVVTNDIVLDGEIRLISSDDTNKAQLVQTHTLESKISGNGKLLIDQNSEVPSLYRYNYMSSPVSNTSSEPSYSLESVFRDGTEPLAFSGVIGSDVAKEINFIGGYDGDTLTSPISLADYWVYSFAPSAEGRSNWAHKYSDGVIGRGEGFIFKGPGRAQNYTFLGAPNDGNFTTPEEIGGDEEYLIGNPFASALNARKFIEDNEESLTGSLYFWEHHESAIGETAGTIDGHTYSGYVGGYAVITSPMTLSAVGTSEDYQGIAGIGDGEYQTPGPYIAIGQGFMVVGDSDGGTIEFNNSQRAYIEEGDGVSVFFKSAETNTKSEAKTTVNLLPIIKLGFDFKNDEDLQLHRQIGISFSSKNSFEFDKGYDTEIFDEGVTDIYWKFSTDEAKYIIAGVQEISADLEVPLTIVMDHSGEINLMIDELQNVPNDVFITDKLTSTSYNIKESLITLTLEAGEYTDRFVLGFKEVESSLGVDDSILGSNVSVFLDNDSKEIVINNTSNLELKSIKLFNLLGQKVDQWSDLEQENKEIRLRTSNLSNTVYIVNIETEKGKVSRKIVIE
ncbi:LamG-like jellyroll fold domain-containing protein [Polaribacter sp. Asnod1-A03]|uniref:LamG-like jellyroll fold domain-containing protein n=1 Tax=Polaribacter sp. Asnod1-A03 TaxID=3160581 RepID=UPI00386991A1